MGFNSAFKGLSIDNLQRWPWTVAETFRSAFIFRN